LGLAGQSDGCNALLGELSAYSTLGKSGIVDVNVVIGRVLHDVFNQGGISSLATLRGARLGRIKWHLDGTIFARRPFMDMRRRGLLNILHGQVITHFAFVRIE